MLLSNLTQNAVSRNVTVEMGRHFGYEKHRNVIVERQFHSRENAFILSITLSILFVISSISNLNVITVCNFSNGKKF